MLKLCEVLSKPEATKTPPLTIKRGEVKTDATVVEATKENENWPDKERDDNEKKELKEKTIIL
jgi:hypothetical protein